MSNQASGALDIGLPKQSYRGENVGHITIMYSFHRKKTMKTNRPFGIKMPKRTVYDQIWTAFVFNNENKNMNRI